MTTWETLPLSRRIEIVTACGWVTIANRISKLGQKIAMTSWAELSPAAKRIISQKGR